MIALLVQAPPPDTARYYHIAYGWVAVLYSGYAALLWRRTRRVRARLDSPRRRENTDPRAT